jgi:hypothetical protein
MSDGQVELRSEKIHAVVHLSQLGVNCWLALRFVESEQRCKHWETCKYPEKKTCMAIHAEIAFHEHVLAEKQNEVEDQRHVLEELRMFQKGMNSE